MKYYPYVKSLFSHVTRHLRLAVWEKNVVLKTNILGILDFQERAQLPQLYQVLQENSHALHGCTAVPAHHTWYI